MKISFKLRNKVEQKELNLSNPLKLRFSIHEKKILFNSIYSRHVTKYSLPK